ncbi:MAG TPA: ring-cleaving dioxygenase [bacterium]|nr:ring-cleaving dioxygenase [bacterium]
MNAAERLAGIHHVTAIAGDPQQNVDFYAGTLGLRLVKQTVNFDDPGTYHLYFGDAAGHPGTILTFFPWPGAPKGRHGAGQATVVSFSVPPDSIGFWEERLRGRGITFEALQSPFDESVLEFSDPHGLQLELVADPRKELGQPWAGAPVPVSYAIRGFHSVALLERSYEGTEGLLTKVMGFRLAHSVGHRRRYAAAEGGLAAHVDVVGAPDASPGHVAVGTVHHVAWRAATDEAQRAWRQRLVEAGVNVTPVRDRQYFRSIYYHEPGGVLFEIATDPPGFGVDEPPEALGSRLRLPAWLEPRREALEAQLPPLHPPPPQR